MFLLRAWSAGPGSTAEDLVCCAALPSHLSHQSCAAQWDSDRANPFKVFVPGELCTFFLSSANPELRNWIMVAPLSQEKLDCLRFSQLFQNILSCCKEKTILHEPLLSWNTNQSRSPSLHVEKNLQLPH